MSDASSSPPPDRSRPAKSTPPQILIVNPRPPRLRIGLILGLALAILAALLLTVRLTVTDWRGLLPEVFSPLRDPGSPPQPNTSQIAGAATPTPLANPAQKDRNPDAPDSSEKPSVEKTVPELALEKQPPAQAAPAEKAKNDSPPSSETAAALDDIEREAQRKRQEAEEFAKLRKELDSTKPRTAPPQQDPMPFPPVLNEDFLAAMRKQAELQRRMREQFQPDQEQLQGQFGQMLKRRTWGNRPPMFVFPPDADGILPPGFAAPPGADGRFPRLPVPKRSGDQPAN